MGRGLGLLAGRPSLTITPGVSFAPKNGGGVPDNSRPSFQVHGVIAAMTVART